MNDARYNIKERELEKVDQTQAHRYISRFEHTALPPPSHRRIFTNSSTQDFPHREPPLRIWANTTRSTQLLSQQYNLYTRGKAQHKSPLHLEGWALNQTKITSHLRDSNSITSHQREANTTPTITSSLRGISTQSPLTRGISQRKEGLQHLVVSTNHKPIFLTKTRSYRQDRYDKLKCEKIKCLKQRKTIEKISKQILKSSLT